MSTDIAAIETDVPLTVRAWQGNVCVRTASTEALQTLHDRWASFLLPEQYVGADDVAAFLHDVERTFKLESVDLLVKELEILADELSHRRVMKP